MEEVIYIATIEQMRGIADPIRLRIFERLVREQLTVTQLGVALGESPAKLHYHVRELEQLGFIKLVETREKGGILEKYYRAVAKDIQVPSELLRTTAPDDIQTVVQEWFRFIANEGTKAISRALQTPGGEPLTLGSLTVWATNERFRALLEELQELLGHYRDPTGAADEREWTVSLLAHSTDSSDAAAAGSTEESPATERSASPPAKGAQPLRRKRIFVGGAMELTRGDLERAVANQEQYDIQAIGVVRFADDVTPDLIDQAVVRFRHRGKLHASPAVREALGQKGAQTPGREQREHAT